MVDYGYLDDMRNEVTSLQNELRQLEKKAYNTSNRDDQFSHVSVEEVGGKQWMHLLF